MLVIALIAILAFFAVAQIRIFVIARHALHRKTDTPIVQYRAPRSGVWPTVTVQLPVYREHASLPRLLDAVLGLEYPAGLLAVQVLDDSEDDEAALTSAIVDARRSAEVPMDYVHRDGRSGY